MKKELYLFLIPCFLFACNNHIKKDENSVVNADAFPSITLTEFHLNCGREIPTDKNFREDFCYKNKYDLLDKVEKIDEEVYNKSYPAKESALETPDTLKLDSLWIINDGIKHADPDDEEMFASYAYELKMFDKQQNCYVVEFDNLGQDYYGNFLINKKTGVIQVFAYQQIKINENRIVSFENQEEIIGFENQYEATKLRFYDVDDEGIYTLTYGLWNDKIRIIDFYWKDKTTLFLKCTDSDDNTLYFSLNTDQMKQEQTISLSEKWVGKYTVYVSCETIASIRYNFTIRETSVDLETNTIHSPIRCNGSYFAKEDENGMLHLKYWEDKEDTCHFEEFWIKESEGNYYILGVGCLETSSKWIELESESL